MQQQLCSVIIQHFLQTRAFFSSWGRGFLGYPLPFQWDICSPGFIQGSWWDSSVNVHLLVFRAWINRDTTVKLQLNLFVAQDNRFKKNIYIKRKMLLLLRRCWGEQAHPVLHLPPQTAPRLCWEAANLWDFLSRVSSFDFYFFCVLSLSRLCSANFDPRWWNRAI